MQSLRSFAANLKSMTTINLSYLMRCGMKIKL
jgi:hypothetical protein